MAIRVTSNGELTVDSRPFDELALGDVNPVMRDRVLTAAVWLARDLKLTTKPEVKFFRPWRGYVDTLKNELAFYDPGENVIFVHCEAPAELAVNLISHEYRHAWQHASWDGHKAFDTATYEAKDQDAMTYAARVEGAIAKWTVR